MPSSKLAGQASGKTGRSMASGGDGIGDAEDQGAQIRIAKAEIEASAKERTLGIQVFREVGMRFHPSC
jgi:hypothetical protein